MINTILQQLESKKSEIKKEILNHDRVSAMDKTIIEILEPIFSPPQPTLVV